MSTPVVRVEFRRLETGRWWWSRMGGDSSIGRGLVRWAGTRPLGGDLSIGRGLVCWAGTCPLGGEVGKGMEAAMWELRRCGCIDD